MIPSLLVALLACSGGAAPPAAPEPTPISTPAEAPEASAYAQALGAELATLEKRELPVFSEGDYTREASAWSKDGAWVRVRIDATVGEYSSIDSEVSLRGGLPVYRTRSGYEHAPTDEDGSRFRHFEEQVTYGADGGVESARHREVFTEGVPLKSPDLSGQPWQDLAEPEPNAFLEEVLADLAK